MNNEVQNEAENAGAEAEAGEPKFEIRGFNAGAAGEEAQGEGENEVSAEEADQIMAGATPGAASQGEIPKAEPKVKIGDREFATSEEAWSYAQELEREKLAADAFRHGLETAQQVQLGNPQPAQAAPEESDSFDVEFYANPKEFLKKYGENIKSQVKTELEQQQSLKQKNDETWKQFYSDYPDLVSAQKLVQITLSENFDRLRHVNTKVALKEIADKVREERKRLVADLLPGTELKQVKQTASPGGGHEVTRPQAEDKALSLVQQFRNIKRKRTAGPIRR